MGERLVVRELVPREALVGGGDVARLEAGLLEDAWASVNCSRNQGSIIALSSGRPHMLAVDQRGRGHEPVTVAGSIGSFVAVNIYDLLRRVT